MAFTKVLIAGSAFFAAALAQGVAFTEWPTSVTAGQPATLRWIGDAGAPVTLTLRKGASTALNDVEVISPDATNGEFTWTPSTDLENASDYAFQISQGDQINYSGLVSLGGGKDAPPPAPASASGPQSDTAAAVASGTTMASFAQSMTSGVDREMTTSAPSIDSAPTSASATASDAATTTSGPSEAAKGSHSSAQATDTSNPSVVARPSLMNTPFNAANDGASETATGSSSVHTGAAGRVTVPVALSVASSALLWFFQ